MSVQFGIWSFTQHSVPHVIDRLSEGLAQWGPDGIRTWRSETGMLVLGAGAFHVTQEDLRQVQPVESRERNLVATFDGRIDNRFSLMNRLEMGRSNQSTVYTGSWNPGEITSGPLPLLALLPKGDSVAQPACWRVSTGTDPTDIEILAAAFSSWNLDAFRQLRGEWAGVVWDETVQKLWLAKDVFGPRHLHYVSTEDFFCWSTRYEVLRDLVRSGAIPITLTGDKKYQAANAIAMPATDATPFCEIRSIKPGSAIKVQHGRRAETVMLALPPQSNPQSSISFDTAARVMKHSLERSIIARTRSAFPVMFELSGGCDSSTLVCLANQLRRIGKLDNEIYTVTRFNPDNRHSQDLAYARVIEDHIGKRGRHVRIYAVHDDEDKVSPTATELSAFNEKQNALMEQSSSLAMKALWSYRAGYTDAMRERGSRVLLSGVGGDELTGGSQFAAISLGETLRHAPKRFLPSAAAWARYKNETVWRLAWQTLLEFLPIRLASRFDGPSRRQAHAAHRALDSISPSQLRMMRYAFSGSVHPWRSRRQQEEDCWPLSTVLSHKQRLCHIGCWQRAFPFIEMEWVRICSMFPPDYLQTAFQRRRLHRAAFAGIVPHKVLWRATKDFGPLTARRSNSQDLTLRDLEENAALQQILKAASQFDLQGSDPALRSELPMVGDGFADGPLTAIDDTRLFVMGRHVRIVISDQGATLLDTIRGKRVVLNPAGGFILQEMQKGLSVREIARRLSQDYELPLSSAFEDTCDLLEDLAQNGLIETLSANGAIGGQHVQPA